jgi:hypothetical protein
MARNSRNEPGGQSCCSLHINHLQALGANANDQPYQYQALALITPVEHAYLPVILTTSLGDDPAAVPLLAEQCV